MSLTAKDVAEIMRLLEDSSFDELSLETDGFTLHLRRGEGGVGEGPAPQRERPARPAPVVNDKPAAPAVVATAPADPSLSEVPSPLLGVFYRAPKPGDEPFVSVGDQVEADTVIAIIEVMKLMNSVRAGVKGEVVEIPAQNGALVEYGETLIRVRKAG